MFSTGSKFFITATALSLIATLAFGTFTGGDTYWTSMIGLISVTVALTFLTAINFFVRDSNVGSMQPDAKTDSAAAQETPGNSMWPAAAALGGGLLVVGLITEPIVFKAGIVISLACLLEWTVQAWSERASGDRAYNADVRKRVLHPLEFPVLGAIGLAIIVYSFSRIMLFASKESGPAIFGAMAALVLVAGFLFATQASLKKSVAVGVCAIAALGLVSTGAVMAIDGERPIEEHPTVSNDPAVCASNAETEVDVKASQSLAAKSNISATIFYDEGKLYAEVIGVNGPQHTITLPRSAHMYIVFRNLTDQKVRLTAHMGAFNADLNGTAIVQKPVTCTALVDKDGRQFLELTFPKPSPPPQGHGNSLEPYTLSVPGVDGASVDVVVP
ncbi:MAG: hypothetical protein JWN99_3272 [Ilumatobacteraceae bacterium]|nr:hypothetical protein [Ilumatobacteraceae bacterium]